MNKILKNSYLWIAISVFTVFCSGWCYVNSVARNNSYGNREAFFAFAGQFGDKFGFINAIFTAVGVVFLVANYAGLKDQLKEAKNEKRYREVKDTNERILGAIDDLIRMNMELKKNIIVYERDRGYRTSNRENGLAIDQFIDRQLQMMDSMLSNLKNSNSDEKTDEVYKMWCENTFGNNAADLERYFNTVHQMGCLVILINDSGLERIIFGKLHGIFTFREILFIGSSGFTKTNINKSGIRIIWKLFEKYDRLDDGYESIANILKYLYRI